MSQHLVNVDSGHARTLDSEDEFDWELGQIELRRFQDEADLLLVPVLTHLPVRHRIERGALRAWLREHHEGDECALIEESLWRWWNGDDDTVCALLLIPAIESLVQHRAEQRGIAVTSPAVGRRRAGFKSLGDLLASLSNRMDESWRRYLLCVLVSEYGLNLRNDLCHGIRLSASSRDVAALVIAALHLIRMPDAEP
ncbi:MAG: DUF4209 domain-containing protein [Ahniella sp.]|nr:DUF4209 domain-containing protein [Ahniella sp.]